MTVPRDCTGTYLNYNGKDYRVCNLEAVASFPGGSSVTATFKKIKKCTDSAQDAFVCMMVHENEGWITVEKIK